MMMAMTTLIRVLLVDDHHTMLWGLGKLIGGDSTGMEVVASVSTAAEAVAQSRIHAPDVVLLDLDLNGENSIGIIPLLSANGHTRVLLFTGTHEQAEMEAAVMAGASGIVRKHAPAELLLTAITKVHAGELWIEPDMMARVMREFTHPAHKRRSDPEAEKQATLTPRELSIIDAVVAGHGALNKSLAQSLCISEHTLRNHLVSIYKKLGVGNRLELYVYAVRYHLTPSS